MAPPWLLPERKSGSLAPNDPADAIRLLRLSLDDLRNAAQHIDLEYKAQAWYERSKSSYHLARLEPLDETHRKVCMEDAEKAATLSDEKKFFTWWEHIQETLATPAG